MLYSLRHWTLAAWRGIQRRLRFKPSPQLNEEYKAAHEFKNNFTPIPDANYDWVKEYARETLEAMQRSEDSLDSKAEWLVKLLGGGTGLVTIGALLRFPVVAEDVSIYVVSFLGVAILVAFAAIWAAIVARTPSMTAFPPSIAWALNYVGSYRADAENTFLAQWHLACEGRRIAIQEKARWVTRAMALAGFAVAAFTATPFVAYFTLDKSPAAEKTESGVMPTDPHSPDNSSDNLPQSAVPDPSGAPQTPSSALSVGSQINLRQKAKEEKVKLTSPSTAQSAEPQSFHYSKESEEKGKIK